MLSLSGTLSVSRSSGSGSGSPLLLRQISAVSSRSPSAPSPRLELWSGEPHSAGAVDIAQGDKGSRPVLVERLGVQLGEANEELPDLFLPALAGLDLFEPNLLVLLVAGGKIDKSPLGL